MRHKEGNGDSSIVGDGVTGKVKSNTPHPRAGIAYN